jgi:phosphoribosylanthranilate isomerase
MPKVKICGITNLDDARAAVEAGADAIGFIMAESPRRVTPEQVRSMLQSLGGLKRCVPVGVFVDEPAHKIIKIAELVGLRVVQLHGNEPPETVETLRASSLDVVKSFRINAENDIEALASCGAAAYLLDTFVPGLAGGTGRAFNWELALRAKRYGRVILAGGLGVDNVSRAVTLVEPYGVDASSRLEIRPGVKNHELVKRFIEVAKSTAGSESEETTPWPR